MNKINPVTILLFFFLTACDGWSYSVPTFPAPEPTITPSIYTPTPVIVTITNTSELPANTPTETTTLNPATALNKTITPTPSLTSQPITPQFIVEILGCNTSIDILHAMGEVTNAFVTIKNNTGASLSDLCATLLVLDEGRIHPDKIVCVPELEQDQQLTLKLTVDSTFKEKTSIQVEVRSSETLLARVANPSCTDIGLFTPDPVLLMTPIPIQ